MKGARVLTGGEGKEKPLLALLAKGALCTRPGEQVTGKLE